MPVNENQLKDLMERSIEKDTTIKQIDIKLAREVFGKEAMQANRQTVVVTTELGGSEGHSLPNGMTYENGDWNINDQELAAKSLRSQNSWFRKFIAQYKALPTVGMKIRTMMDDNGFARIEVGT